MNTTIPLYDYEPKPISGKYTFLFLGILFSCILTYRACNKPQFDVTTTGRAAFGLFASDTTKPVKQRVYNLTAMPENDFIKIVDSLQMIMTQFGVEKYTSETQFWNGVFYRQLNKLGSRITLDSVTVKR